MDAATLLLLTSSVGVGFGWQPMPDGTPRVEYLVQIEPEMLTALQAGSTIPIVSEVPEGIGPIGRVRIVIGREPLPRQNLAPSNLAPSNLAPSNLAQPLKTTRHKPDSAALNPIASGKPSTAGNGATGIQQTQFTTPAPPPPNSRAPGYAQPAGLTSQPARNQNSPAPALPANPLGGNMYQKAIEAGQRQAAAAQSTSAPAATTSAPAATTSAPAATGQIPPATHRRGSVGVQSGAAPGWPGSATQVPAEHTIVGGNPPAAAMSSGVSANAPSGLSFPVTGQNVQKSGNAQLPSAPTHGQSPDAQPPGALAQPGQANNPQTQAAQTRADSPPGMFSLLLAWVLLFGSSAGNVYLFWSYLDIRGKYQAVIHSQRVPRSQYSRA